MQLNVLFAQLDWHHPLEAQAVLSALKVTIMTQALIHARCALLEHILDLTLPHAWHALLEVYQALEAHNVPTAPPVPLPQATCVQFALKEHSLKLALPLVLLAQLDNTLKLMPVLVLCAHLVVLLLKEARFVTLAQLVPLSRVTIALNVLQEHSLDQ